LQMARKIKRLRIVYTSASIRWKLMCTVFSGKLTAATA